MMRRAAVAGIALAAWTGLMAEGAGRPPFTLEQIVGVRTIDDCDLSPDRRRAVCATGGFYFGFAVAPRFGDGGNLRLIDLQTAEQVQLTSGTAPKQAPRFGPDGRVVLFESEDDLWIVEVESGRTRRVTTNGARDEAGRISPDGRSVVFVSARDQRTDLWVADAAGERHGLRRLTQDAAVEDDPQWSPDGTGVAFAATRADEHFYARGIYLVGAEGGQPRRLTPADATDNSAPRWAPDGTRIAYLSDRSGFVHVWIHDLRSGEQTHVDHGPADAYAPQWRLAPVWAPAGDRILVSVNVDGRFVLHELDARRRAARVLAGTEGSRRAVGWRADGAVVALEEHAWAPPDLVAHGPAGERTRLTSSGHAAFRREHMARVERVRLASTDGVELSGFLLTPTTRAPGRRPAVLSLHTNSYGQFYDHWAPFHHYLAQSGYVILQLDQRGSSGYGRAHRNLAVGAWGTRTSEDVAAGAAWLRARPDVDGDRVAVMGFSFGAYLTLMAMTRSPGTFQAGVAIMGVADRRPPFAARNAVFHIGATPAEAPDLYERVSPITAVDRVRHPLLVIHSDADRNVPPEHTYRLQDAFERAGVPHEVVVYPGEAHGLASPAHQLDSYRRIEHFLARVLEARPAAGPTGAPRRIP